MRLLLAFIALALPLAPLRAQPADLGQRVDAILREAPAGTRIGLLVTTLEGAEVLTVAPDQRFLPASNTKMFTTAAAYAHLAALDGAARGTGVVLEGAESRPDVVLLGRGDPRLSSAADCMQSCLSALADAVAARTMRVNDIIGDDRWFPDERWSPGMSWNNIPTRSGTGTSALTLDDNELAVLVRPAAVGAAPTVEGLRYFTLDNQALTVPGGEVKIGWWRDPGGFTVRLMGTIGADAPAERLRFGIDNPAHYAAWRLRELLVARGIDVKGRLLTRHRPVLPQDDPTERTGPVAPAPADDGMLATVPALPVAEDVTIINKLSQNLHAELLLRHLGRLAGTGSIAEGRAVMQAVLMQAGMPENGIDLSDGSGMSSYNRITPRAAVTLLGWVARQPWGAAWRESLPVGGRDGTLHRRFAGTALDGRIFAKTGSLNATNTLSGYLLAKSGRTLIFSILSNDCPDGETDKAIAAMDKALLAMAEAN